MAPKRAKNSAKKDAGNKNWEAALTNELFEEDSWKACVSLVVEACPEDEALIQALVAAVQKPARKLFSVLSWDNTQAKIHEYGNTKNKKYDNVPMFSEVTEPAKVLLDAGDEIPLNLLAKLIKFQLLQIKNNDKQRRDAEQDKLATVKAKPAAKGKGGAKDKKGKVSSPVLEKVTSLKRRDEVDPPDYIDDEPDDGPQHYVLMVGFYQADLFSELDSVGVRVCNVIKLSPETREQPNTESSDETETISDKGTLVSAIEEEYEDRMLRLAARTKQLDVFWSCLRSHLDSGPPDSQLHDVVELNYSVSQPSVNVQEPEDMLTLGSSIFEGIACIIYDTLDWRRQHQHYLDRIKLIDVPKLSAPEPVVEPVVSAPLNRSKKKQAPEESQSTQETLTTDVNMSHYNKLLDTVPPEACSVPLMLHCMLEQVVLTLEPPVPPAPPSEPEESTDTGPFLDQQLVNYLLHHFLPLVYTEDEKTHLLDGLNAMVSPEDKKTLLERYGPKEEKTTDPQVFRHHDERAIRLRNSKTVEELNPAEVEKNMLRLSPVCDLIHSVALQKNASCWMAIKQQLKYYCYNDTASWPEVERWLDQSVFESMPLTQLDHEGVLLKPTEPLDSLGSTPVTTTTIPWDDPVSFAKQQLWHLQNQGPTFLTEDATNTKVNKNVPIHLELSAMQSCRQRSLSDWHYTEHHNPATFPQVLQEAAEQYRCLDTFRGSKKQVLYIYCHNLMDEDRHCKESWAVVLHSNVKFRKYLENVADKISEWTKEEESNREEMNKVPSVETPKEEDTSEKEPEPVIRKESLKAWKLAQEKLKEEELAKKSKKEMGKGKPAKTSPKDKKEEKAKPSAKKNRANTASSDKTLTDRSGKTKEIEQSKEEEELYAFTGYNMDGEFIHVSGQRHHLYPSDGGCVAVETASYVKGSSLVKVVVKKDGHSFHTHVNHSVAPNTTPKEGNKGMLSAGTVRVRQGSLTAALDNGIRLAYSCYGPTGQHTENVKAAASKIPDNVKETQAKLQNKPENPSSPTEPPVAQEVKTGLVPFNSLSLSLPNGLLLQLLREDSQGVPSEELGMLVRQSFPLHGEGNTAEIPDVSLSKEVSRLVTSQGAVVRNMKDGSTMVLFADGAVSSSQDSGPVSGTDDTTQDDDSKEQSPAENEETERGIWSTTTPSGVRFSTVGTSHKRSPTAPRLLVFKATDPVTKEVMQTREDRVVSVQSPDGSMTVEHTDGTRITTLYEDSLVIHRGERPSSTPHKSSPECPLSLEDDRGDDTDLEPGNKERAPTTSENSSASLSGSRISSENEGVPIKEKVVLVEKEGCATVVMYPDRRMAHVFLADGTVITGNTDGAFQVFPSSVGLLQIHSDGKCVYMSDPLDTPRPGGAAISRCGTYTMSHCDGVACDVTDPDGNLFQVMEDGTISFLSPASSRCVKDGEGDRTGSEKRYEHSPRLFIAHENGSGTELLLTQTVEELLFQAYSEPTVAIMKEPLPDTEDEYGITILRPCHESMWSQWFLAKQKADITPPHLRNRSLNDFPRAEKVTAGPPFGTDRCVLVQCRALSFTPRCGGSVTQNLPLRSCPKVLEMRELQQHRPFTSPLSDTLDTQLKEYIERLMEKEQRSEQMRIKDPRSEKESGHASDLLNLVLSFAEEEESSCSTEKQISDISSLYMQGIGGPVESGASEATITPECVSFAIGSDSQWTGRLALYRRELCEEKACRDALRKNTVVPYFHLENLPLYETLLHQEISDTRNQVSPVLQKPKVERKEKPKKIPSPKPTKSRTSLSPSRTAFKVAAKSPTDPLHQSAAESTSKTPSAPYKSVNVDVTGQPRKSKVKLPTCIKTTKPCSVPNHQFWSVEEPVRRRCRTISLINPDYTVRGFHLHPPSVEFGPVLEGTTSSVTVVMKNVGVDTCRFNIKQPPPSTGLRVLYNPGPVAAGLHIELHIQLLALYSAQPGETETGKPLTQDITIHTETDIIYLPVTANILSRRLSDVWLQDHKEHNKRASRASKPSNRVTLQPPTQPDLNTKLSP
ncbi:sperm-associated antigen 17 [Eucyclogobius newberryi]|uniref:sperm-associated antigen 17 n=1 Tax=Eucyclogobius newberryi TaxID=166745 RepID=UPI003B5B5E56